jgi:hypothetical protein
VKYQFIPVKMNRNVPEYVTQNGVLSSQRDGAVLGIDIVLYS